MSTTNENKLREAEVLAVLQNLTEPTGPSEIGRLVGQSWAREGLWGKSAAVVPVLRRLGAVRHKGGKYTAPVEG